MLHRHKKKSHFFDWGKPAKKLENWGKTKILNKKTKNLFSGVGVAAVTAIFAMGIFAGIFIVARFVRQAIETKISQNLIFQIQHTTEQNQPAAQPPQILQNTTTGLTTGAPEVPPGISPTAPAATPPSNLIYTSFTDLFSGNGWLNSGATTMYRDNNETAFMFPPKFIWQPIGSPGSLQTPPVPAGITTKVVQDGSTYEVLVYAPDGSAILSATNTPITSDYSGQVGIGGTTNDFLVVYSAYQGAGAWITNVNGTWEIQNISQFFGIRSMGGGFQPIVAKVGDNWYVWNDGTGIPKLIKLFTNGTGAIQGAIDLSQNLFTHGEQSATFGIASNGATLLSRAVGLSGAVSYYSFTDEGFDKSQPLQIVSANISNYPGTVYSATVSDITLSEGGADASFYFSNDGVHWIPATRGQAVAFPTPKQPLYWEAVFTPSGDEWSSPWFDTMGISYTVLPPN